VIQRRGSAPSAVILERVWRELGVLPHGHEFGTPPPRPVPLPSRLAASDLAWASVRAVCLMAGIHSLGDPDRIAVAYRSDRVLTLDGNVPGVWSPFSGFWRTYDAWIRTHGNYPHHASGLLSGLRLSGGAGSDDVRAALLRLTTAEAVRRITTAKGLAVPVLHEHPERDALLRSTPARYSAVFESSTSPE
jgi:hypothetical protein